MTERYSKLAVVLHWLIAIGIFLNLYSGLGFDDLPKDKVAAAFASHESIGISVLGLVLLRVLWRIGHQPPAPLAGLKPVEQKLATGIHHLLYLLMVLIPLSGWLTASAHKGPDGHGMRLFNTVPWFNIAVFGGLAPDARHQAHELLGSVHSAAAWVLMGALVLHVLGALKHQFLGREKLFQRMWFGS